MCNNKKTLKKIKIKPNTLGNNVVAPDGGWGWMIILACGISNLCVLPVLQNFGLIFRDRFVQLGLSSSEITTVINFNLATTSILGLANGPMFRRFSFRQVACFGGFVCSIATIVLSMTSTFTGIFICMAIFHAAGMGITLSANSLALNTYFKKKRRIAVGLSWTCTGIGPIIMPQIITILIPKFDVSGTVLILGAFTLNAISSALLLHPVSWHAKKLILDDKVQIKTNKETDSSLFLEKECNENVLLSNKSNTILTVERHSSLNLNQQKFGSQYLFYDDEEEGAAGIDVISSETPMISRGNDGWFSSSSLHVSAMPRTSSMKLITSLRENQQRKPSYQGILNQPLVFSSQTLESSLLKDDDLAKKNKNQHLIKSDIKINEDLEVIRDIKKSLLKRWTNTIVIFFDLGLLKDYVFVTLMLGINLALFVETNFAVLTPFILSEYKLTEQQIATVLSTLAATDVMVRLSISFIASKIGWGNRTFFLIGIGCMAAGRSVIAHVSSYKIIIVVSVFIGFGKGLRTIFMALVIPSHVPLSRLPAASGLQLVSSGIIYPSLGPLVGWIRDKCGNYTILLHVLNIITCIIILSWIGEAWITSKKYFKKSTSLNNNNLNS